MTLLINQVLFSSEIRKYASFAEMNTILKLMMLMSITKAPLQTHHVYSTLKRRGNGRFHVLSTWNTRSMFVGQLLSFGNWNMRYPSSKFCNSHLLKNFTLIEALFCLIIRFCLSCVFFSFCNFLIPMTTETSHNSRSFLIMCSIQILTMMLI